MPKQILPLFFVALIFALPVFSDEKSDVAAIKSFPSAAEKSEVVLTTGFDTPDDAAKKLPPGYAVKANEGHNGTSVLFYERTNPEAYPLYSIPLNNLVPEAHYVINVWGRVENMKGPKNIAAVCVEYSKDGKWAGGAYGSVIG
jgi:hypothetical protein